MKKLIIHSMFVVVVLGSFGCVKAERKLSASSTETDVVTQGEPRPQDRIALLKATMDGSEEDRQYLEALQIQQEEEDSFDTNVLDEVPE